MAPELPPSPLPPASTDPHAELEALRALVSTFASATWETGTDGIVVIDSPSWRAYTGQTYDEWIGYGRIVVESDGGGVTCVSASLTPLAPFLDSDIAAV